jgi:hypothetical protein
LFGHAGRGRGGFLSGKVDDEDEVARGKVLVCVEGDSWSTLRFLLSNLGPPLSRDISYPKGPFCDETTLDRDSCAVLGG